MALLDDIAGAIVNAGLAGGTSGWTLYKGYLPPEPDHAMVLLETPGLAPEAELALDRPAFQVRLRAEPRAYDVARAKLQAVFAALHGQEPAVGAAYVLLHAAASGALSLGQDGRERPQLAMNFRVVKART